MEDRGLKILLASIKAFIETGEPVSSKELYDAHDFGIKPASIRTELLRLTEEGYLDQPHTSGGRVPTVAGYEFFANQLIGELFGKTLGGLVSLRDSLIDELMSRHTGVAVDELSEALGTLAVGYEPDNKSIYKSGFEELCERLDVGSREEFIGIVHDFEHLNERLEKFSSSLSASASPQVYIGKKSPITESPHLSVIVDSYEIDGEPLLLIAIGPKRTDYKKSLRVFKAIRESVRNKK